MNYKILLITFAFKAIVHNVLIGNNCVSNYDSTVYNLINYLLQEEEIEYFHKKTFNNFFLVDLKKMKIEEIQNKLSDYCYEIEDFFLKEDYVYMKHQIKYCHFRKWNLTQLNEQINVVSKVRKHFNESNDLFNVIVQMSVPLLNVKHNKAIICSYVRTYNNVHCYLIVLNNSGDIWKEKCIFPIFRADVSHDSKFINRFLGWFYNVF